MNASALLWVAAVALLAAGLTILADAVVGPAGPREAARKPPEPNPPRRHGE